MILISNDFWHKIQINNFDPYNVLLVISTNTPVLVMTASVLQSHKCSLNEPNDLYIAFVFSVRSAPNTFELNVLMPNHDEIINSLYNNLKSRPRERKRTNT